ncbi:MAG TPA: DnaJ family domain-containing protein [Anaerolineae bacterium]|nr:DnaJ family domain-containing protein [Anaerolineae bacterium]
MSPVDSEHYVDKQIKQAQEEGAFDDLPGKGKPLTHLHTDPLHQVLQAQGFTTRWLELEHEIRQKTEVAEQGIKRTYEWVMQTWSGGSADRHFAQDEWRKARRIFRERVAEINRLIRNYNLQAPPTIGQKFPMQEEALLVERLGPDFETFLAE